MASANTDKSLAAMGPTMLIPVSFSPTALKSIHSPGAAFAVVAGINKSGETVGAYTDALGTITSSS